MRGIVRTTARLIDLDAEGYTRISAGKDFQNDGWKILGWDRENPVDLELIAWYVGPGAAERANKALDRIMAAQDRPEMLGNIIDLRDLEVADDEGKEGE